MRVLLADNQYIVRIGMREYFYETFDQVEAVEAKGLAEVWEALSGDERFDLLVMDLFLPHRLTEPELAAIRAAADPSPIIVFSTGSQADLRTAVNGGAQGFVTRSSDLDTLDVAVRALLAGGTYYLCHSDESAEPPVQAGAPLEQVNGKQSSLTKLTRRQREVLSLLAEGLSNQSIAISLGLSLSTVKGHVSKILDLLGAENRTQATLMLNRAKPVHAKRLM